MSTDSSQHTTLIEQQKTSFLTHKNTEVVDDGDNLLCHDCRGVGIDLYEMSCADRQLKDKTDAQKAKLEEDVKRFEREKIANAKTHCRCKSPVMTKVEDVKCRACLKPFDMVSMQLMRTAQQKGLVGKYGRSSHRLERVKKFVARVKRQKEKRARAKKNRRKS